MPLRAFGGAPPPRHVAPAGATIAYSHGDPTAQEQLMLELVNRARANPAAEAARFGIDLNQGLAPGTITPDPKQPLAFQPQLISSARAHSDWMLSVDVFSHDGVNASTPGDRMESAGYVFSGSWGWGENIAWRGSTGMIDANAIVIAQHEGLFKSPGHRENICEGFFDEVGIGARTGAFTSLGTAYNAVMATQNFARSASTPGPLVLGVVYRDTNRDGAYSAGEGLAGVTVTPASGDYYAVTSASGGYAFPMASTSGTLEVTFSGASLPSPVARTVTLSSSNVKLDFEQNGDTPLSFTPGSAGLDAQKRFRFELTGPPGAKAQVKYTSNFVSWQTLGTYTLNSGKATVTDSTALQSRRFYKASIAP